MTTDRYPTRRRVDKGQTGLDFLVGAAVFLIAVGFVFGFIPTMFSPFATGDTDRALIADRTAAQLAESTLVADPSVQNILSNESVENFFDEECDELSVGEHVEFQISIGENEFECGGEPDPSSSVTVSQRIVWLDGEQSMLNVRIWS